MENGAAIFDKEMKPSIEDDREKNRKSLGPQYHDTMSALHYLVLYYYMTKR